jgi:hypothetical protein
MALPTAVVDKLRGLLGDDAGGKPIFKELMLRKQRSITDVYRLKLALNRGGIFFTDADILKRFDLLQKAGAGKLTVRSTPLHSTFEWKFALKDVAQAVLGTKSLPQESVEAMRYGEAAPTRYSGGAQAPSRHHSKIPSSAVILPIGETVVTVNGLPANFDTNLVKAISAALMAVARQNEGG